MVIGCRYQLPEALDLLTNITSVSSNCQTIPLKVVEKEVHRWADGSNLISMNSFTGRRHRSHFAAVLSLQIWPLYERGRLETKLGTCMHTLCISYDGAYFLHVYYPKRICNA